MYGTFSPFGSHPRPDLAARYGSKLPKLDPVFLVGEAKTHDKSNVATVAQLAAAAHSTLILCVLGWCISHPVQTKEIEFPDWAFGFGFFYTESVVSIYASHPEGWVVRGHKTWNFFSRLMHEFNGVTSADPRKRLDLFQAAMVVQNHARRFG